MRRNWHANDQARACALLDISPKTLQRRIAKGIYTVTRTGEGQYAELSFTHADLRLTEPALAAPVSTPVLEPAPPAPEAESTPRPRRAGEPEVIILGPIEAKRQADLAFADEYRRGLVGDSAGNKIDGTNERFPTKGAQSLVGSANMYDSVDRTPTETQARMNPALMGAHQRARDGLSTKALMLKHTSK